MVTGSRADEKLVILSPGAGSVTDEVVAKLHAAFPDHRFVEFPAEQDILTDLPGGSQPVVACGGDGTIAAVAKALAGTKRPFGVIAMGTFNNFARSLNLPTDIDEAIEVVRTGRPRPCTLGRVNGEVFLEVAALGLFGDTIALGEAAKDAHFGDIRDRFRTLAAARRFRFRIEGDVQLRGEALSIIVTNTPSTGALVPVGDTSPEEPHLDLLIDHGRSRLAFIGQLLGAFLRRKRPGAFRSYLVKNVRITSVPQVAVHADVSEVGETPATVEAMPGGLHIILPA
jgi:diacylglycerol kinase family enzyme